MVPAITVATAGGYAVRARTDGSTRGIGAGAGVALEEIAARVTLVEGRGPEPIAV